MEHRISVSNHIASWAERVTTVSSTVATVLAILESHAAFIGILIGLIGLLVQWYYRHKEYRLKKLEVKSKGVNVDE